MNDIIKNAAKRANVTLPTGKKWHAFRRTWTTHMFISGADIGSVRDLGNWSDDTMPLWYNDGMRFEEQRELLNKLPSLDPLKIAECQNDVKLILQRNQYLSLAIPDQ